MASIFEIKQRIHVALEQSEMTQKEIAQRSDITEACISRFATGDRLPNTRSLIALCETLGVSADWLLFGVEPSKRKSDE